MEDEDDDTRNIHAISGVRFLRKQVRKFSLVSRRAARSSCLYVQSMNTPYHPFKSIMLIFPWKCVAIHVMVQEYAGDQSRILVADLS